MKLRGQSRSRDTVIHFSEERNSKRRSIETVYMCSSNGFELFFEW